MLRARLAGQNAPWQQPWKEPQPPRTPDSGPGVPAASPKSLSSWELGEPQPGRLNSHLAHPEGLARSDFTLHTQAVRTEQSCYYTILTSSSMVRPGRAKELHNLSQPPHWRDKGPERLGNLYKVSQCPEHSKSSQHCGFKPLSLYLWCVGLL